jgi:cobalt-zinc-cadmium efflux system membrane fusion protein
MIITGVFLLVLAAGTFFVLQSEPARPNDSHAHGDEPGGDHDDHAESREMTGPHGGKLLAFGEYEIELSIFEDGVPPEFRLYASDGTGERVSIDPSRVSIALTRPDRVDSFTFTQAGEFLQSEQDIAEPHEFGVSLALTIGQQTYDTSYYQEESHAHNDEPSHEGGSLGRIALTEEALASNDIRIAAAGKGTITQELELPGEIVLDADKVAHIVPRFPGIAQSVFKNLGDDVRSGEALAVIQSNQSVAPYEVKSLVSGTVIEKHITLGEFVRDDADIFVVADMSTVWVKISIYAKYLANVKVGQRVRLTASGVDEAAEGVIDYVGPIVGERTRTGQARIVLKNPKGIWLPGLFVTAKIAVSTTEVPLAVPDDAIQTVEGSTAVFVREGDQFEARVIQTGRSDGRMVEVLAGIKPGEEYVASNSFLLKAEFGKSEAGHDH